MHIRLYCVGKLRAGPEQTLVEDYATRFRKTGKGIGFRSLEVVELASGGGLEAEGERLLAALPDHGQVLRLDEQGAQWPSKTFAQQLERRRDDGIRHLSFLIGGAEGYSQAVRQACPQTLAFGPQTWPHRLVRVLLIEQLYRAASLLSGSPYHKA